MWRTNPAAIAKLPIPLSKKKLRDHFQDEMFTGYDTDQTMLRITAMNTILHGMDNADIRFNDSLSKNVTAPSRVLWCQQRKSGRNGYDLSVNRYKKVEYVPKEYPPVTNIMQNIRGLYKKLDDVLTKLEERV